MSKAPHAGGEIDSFCTKCRMILNHRIIAMVGSPPKRVECSTCNSHHNYRARPPGEKAEPGSVSSKKGVSEPRAARVSHVTKAAQARRDLEHSWEKAIAGRAVSDFKRYTVAETFQAGDLVRHTRFGDGVVTQVIDNGKVVILFKDEPRTLAQGLTS
jgi:hypothetical protein